jgi:zinc protease
MVTFQSISARIAASALAPAMLALAMLTAALAAIPAAAQNRPGSKVQSFTVDGIPVILAPADNELVSVVIGLEGGIAGGETDNPELSDFAADVISGSGSRSFPKEELRSFLSETSTKLGGSGDLRGLTYTMTATLPNFGRAWDLLASIITEPVVDGIEFRNAMQRRVANIKRRWSSPEGYASLIADSLVKLTHPVLGNHVELGDVESVTAPAIEAYLKRISERSRMLVVVVGNVSQNDIKKKLAAFSALPAGTYSRREIPELAAAMAPTVSLIDRSSPTTYVQGSFAGPRSDDPSFWSLQVGLSHLRNILFEELRTKRNLTYAPGASLSSTIGYSRGIISVSSTLPDSSIAVMYHELEKMRRGEIDEKELNNSKQVFTTIYLMRQMTNDGLAMALYTSQRNAGDWKRAFSFDEIAAVTKESVRRAFEKYARNLQVGVVGQRGQVTEEKYIFREDAPASGSGTAQPGR